MVGVTPSVRWFGSSWIGTKVIFFSITAVADEWTLEEKISESSSQADERTFMEVGTISEAWAVYTCSKVGEPGTNAVIKIRMQYALFFLLLLVVEICHYRHVGFCDITTY